MGRGRSVTSTPLFAVLLLLAGAGIGAVESVRGGQPEAAAPSAEPESLLSGTVTDILSGRPVPGLNVSIAGVSVATDSRGRYAFRDLPPAADRMEVRGDRIIPRSLMVRHGRRTAVDVTVKPATFNNAMFWASASHNERIMRWREPPKWVVYTHFLDSDPPEPMSTKEREYLCHIITRELPEISTFFAAPDLEVFEGRPNDDPRWTDRGQTVGHILCAPMRGGHGVTGWRARDMWVRYAKVRNNVRHRQVWRHEIAHALGMGHARKDKKWLPLGKQDPNYRPTKLADPVEMYTDWDKLWLRCVYSGSRPAGNSPPDRDPDNYLWGDTTGQD